MIAKFIADVHLAKLARHLRMLGLDTAWEASLSDDEILRRSKEEGRQILTRDRELGERAGPGHVLMIEDDDPGLQLIQVLDAFELRKKAQDGSGFLTRCLQCNSVLLPLPPHQVADRVPGHLLVEKDRFFLCPRCERVYWEGTHVDRMRKWILDLLGHSPCLNRPS